VAAAFVQALFTGQSKTAGTSLAITGSLTVTSGNFLAVAFASDDVGSGYSVTDNLGNTYTQAGSTITQAGSVKTMLFVAPVTTGGTLTTQTVSWTTNATAKAAVSGEFSGLGTTYQTNGLATAGAFTCQCFTGTPPDTIPTGGIGIGACGWEGPNGDTITASGGATVLVGHLGTTGGGAVSNITAALVYNTTAGQTFLASADSTSRANAGVGVGYNAVSAFPPRAFVVDTAVARASSY
jgi:hypothetical protein